MLGELMGLRPVLGRIGSLHICTDPRLELLAVTLGLSNYGQAYPLLTQLDFPYRQAAREHFAGHAAHAAVELLNELVARPPSAENPPFAFGAPPEVMLHLLPDWTLHPSIWDNAFLVKRAGGVISLQALVRALRDFAEAANFAAFYEGQRATLEAIVQATLASVGDENLIEEIEAFYGVRQAGYTVILVPLFHHVGFGPSLTLDGARYVYNIMGPRAFEAELPVFGSPAYFRHMQRHEFGHSFVNPLTEKLWPLFAGHFAAYQSVIEAQELANESIIRAITTWFAYGENPEAGDLALRKELEQGFSLTPRLLESIQDYAAHRDAYPTFEAYFPRLADAFAGHAPRRYDALSKARPIG